MTNLFLKTMKLRTNNDVWFVSLTGNDSNSGHSVFDPIQTISKVNSLTFSPGQCVLFRGGDTFSGQLLPIDSGSTNSSIVYGSYGITRATINGSAANALYIRTPTNTAHHLRFENMIFDGAYNPTYGGEMSVVRVYTHDIYFYNCDICDTSRNVYSYTGCDSFCSDTYNLTWDHCTFHSNGRNGIYLGGGTSHPHITPLNCLIIDCEAYDNGWCGDTKGHGVYVEHDTRVIRLYTHDNINNGIKLSNLGDVDCTLTPIMDSCSVLNNGAAGLYLECNGALVTNNLFDGNQGSNLIISNSLPSELTTSDYSKIIGNTFINCTHQESVLFAYLGGLGHVFKNNIVIQDIAVAQWREPINCGAGVTIEDVRLACEFDHNLYYYNGVNGKTFIKDASETHSFSDWQALTGSPDAHSVLLSAVPDFVTRYTNMHPSVGGNLKGLGIYMTELLVDKDGHTRTNPPTPGCYDDES